MNKFLIKVFVLFFCFTSVFSCTDLAETEKQSKIAVTHSRDGFNEAWLEQMRLRLLDTNAVYRYSVEDAAFGVSTLYNILAAYGVSEIVNQTKVVDSISISISGDSLNSIQMRSLSDFVASHIADYAYKLNPGLVMLDIKSSVSGGTAKFKVEAIIGNLSPVDLQNGDNMNCNINAFAGSDCYYSAYGDLDVPNFSILYPGGPCSDPNTETSAQEEVQNVLSNAIPKYVYNAKGVIVGEIKYTNQEENYIAMWDTYQIQELLSGYSECSSLDIPYNDNNNNLADLRYSGDMLNCTVCAIKDYLTSICPSGKVLCHVNIFGTQLGGGYWKWILEYKFCNAVVVPWESEPDPQWTIDGPGILGSNSISSI